MSERYLAGYDDGRADADLCARCGNVFPPGQLCTTCATAPDLAIVLAAYAAALAHIRADHDTLRQLWQLHRRDPAVPGVYVPWCAGCGCAWPCPTRRILGAS